MIAITSSQTALKKIAASRFLARYLSTNAAATSNATANPMETLNDAMSSLKEFGDRLLQLSERVDAPHTVKGLSRPVSLAEITLHSRDATKSDFEAKGAQAARNQLMMESENVREDLQELLNTYLSEVQPQMEMATRLCQETPCGGASWELNMEDLQQSAAPETPDGNQHVNLGGLQDTPCGRLQLASLDFLETTKSTKPQILMASRAHLILSLAQEHQAPLQWIRKEGTKEQQEHIRETFQSSLIPTPWIRSDEEYQNLQQLQSTLR